jgi:hypothetical protein
MLPKLEYRSKSVHEKKNDDIDLRKSQKRAMEAR